MSAHRETLSHFTKAPLGEIRSVVQRPQGDDFKSAYDKPRGLWNMPDWLDGAQRYRIHLVDEPSILHISNGGGMYDFQREFGRDCGSRWPETYIDWPTVAERYDGIIIAPYIWSCRMDMRWYYGWDCASGCIWNTNAVARIEELREAA